MSELEKYTNLIIDKIKKNKISTTEVADCLNKSGNIPLVKPINKGHFRVGKIYLVYGYDESNWTIHEQLQEAEQDSIILVETYNLKERAVFGSLVSKYLLLYKGVSAIVVNGNMRDGGTLIKENYPIWCKNLTPIGSFNKMHEASLDSKIVNKWKYKYEGAIAVCDDSGVVIISKENINEEFLQKLNFIELQEDIWFYCIDTKKWNTFDVVCLQKYRDLKSLPPEYNEAFRKSQK